jgi:hypothetical protein
MQDFATALRDELERNYLPHRTQVNADMKAPVSSPRASSSNWSNCSTPTSAVK